MIPKKTFFLFFSFFNLAKSFIFAGVNASMLDAMSTDCNDCLKVVFILNKILIKLNLIEESIKNKGVIEKA